MIDDDSTPLHGGPDALGAPLHDFSTNANACGPCPPTVAALQAADPTRYPDPAYTALREQLAAFHGVGRERIVLAASASEFIARITAAVASSPLGAAGAVQVPVHAYGDYARAARSWGLPLQTAAPQRPTVLIWACDPSAPLGQAQAALASCIASLREPAVPLVLDRAYEPLRLGGASGLSAAQLARVWQLWSPNKALGLTGVRGAYAIAPEDEAAAQLQSRLQRLAPSWPLGAHAVAMLQSWADEAAQQWLAGCLPTLRSWKAAQQSLCRELGWAVIDSDSNYFCADWSAVLGQGEAPQLLQALRARGVKLRDATSFGLPGHVRLGVREPASQVALADAWAGAGGATLG
ncbi:aminotransferase class I/II-fold pyridoxal phosphate-dependent enzyme [Xenophilus arseniciresistens]|uniref:histidinol-phosphate transaminase n=1 Tax=Xenophilus arseniciresistens TaxID=1283306 RepID=A0AAE3N832_9BURK|nr:aminotransferase class I/II-fold pyridoxal phosphate-dependent enzyme [Xenophilus arseniciresistens]MDA7415632.1 aminotransferase class I/II-fold pyridoxal phosphate-dependent enzyme [Xenophilus arseniciresistens]